MLHVLDDLSAPADPSRLARAAELKACFMHDAARPKPKALEVLRAIRARR